jgi:hypothetical protein
LGDGGDLVLAGVSEASRRRQARASAMCSRLIGNSSQSSPNMNHDPSRTARASQMSSLSSGGERGWCSSGLAAIAPMIVQPDHRKTQHGDSGLSLP